MIRTGKIAVCAAAGFLLVSCGRTSYPKDKVGEKLVGVCKQEYNLDVQAQLVGTTLGVQVEIPGLIDELRKYAPSTLPDLPPVLIEGTYAQQALDFRMFPRGSFTRAEKGKIRDEDDRPREPSEPLKKLHRVSTAILRASLSTDAPLEFYKLIARDPGPDRLDVVLSGHILDSKRVQFYAIPVSELQRRNEISLRHQPEEVARATVASFLVDLRKRPLPQLLSRYTAPSKRFGELLPMVLAVTMEMKGDEGKLKPEQWPVRQISADAVLVDVPLKPIGGSGEFLFTVHLEESGGTLVSIERLEDSKLPKEFRYLGPPEKWSRSFYLEPISLPQFVTDQIAKRAMGEFKTLDPERKKSAAERPATVEEVTRAVVGAAAYVTDSYSFKNFKQITVLDAVKGTRWAIPAAQLPLYRRRGSPDLKPIP